MSKIEKLEARLDGIGHLLADRYIVVPPYQRAYSWTDEQIEELLRDLSDAMREKDAEYFLGTVVLTKHQAGQHAVIDGQQRLATISILICAIRNHFFTIGDDERAGLLHTDYLAKKELRGLSETPHLTLMASDDGFYESHVLPKPNPAAKEKGKAKAKKAFPPPTLGLKRRCVCVQSTSIRWPKPRTRLPLSCLIGSSICTTRPR